MDEDALKDELDQLEQDQLDERLAGAQPVPAHQPPVASKADAGACASHNNLHLTLKGPRADQLVCCRKEPRGGRRRGGAAPAASPARRVDSSFLQIPSILLHHVHSTGSDSFLLLAVLRVALLFVCNVAAITNRPILCSRAFDLASNAEMGHDELNERLTEMVV